MRKLLQLAPRELVEEPLALDPKMSRHRLAQSPQPALSDGSEYLAWISLALSADEQPLALKAIHHPRKTAAAEVRRIRKTAHLHQPARGQAELDEHVVGAER